MVAEAAGLSLVLFAELAAGLLPGLLAEADDLVGGLTEELSLLFVVAGD